MNRIDLSLSKLASISGSVDHVDNNSCLTCVRYISDIRNCVVSLFVSHNYVPVNRGYRRGSLASLASVVTERAVFPPDLLRVLARNLYMVGQVVHFFVQPLYRIHEYTDDSGRRMAPKDKVTSERASLVHAASQRAQ